MESPAETLAAQAASTAARLTELARPADPADLAQVVAGLTTTELLELSRGVSTMSNLVDAIAARVSGEIAARSARDVEEPLAKRMGEKSAPALIAALGNLSIGRAAEWVGVGKGLVARRSLVGESLPCEHPLVADALDSGRLCLTGARMVVQALEHIAKFTTVDEVARVEAYLVEQAALVGVTGLRPLARGLVDRYDTDGIEPREEALRQKAFLKTWERDGMFCGRFAADPENGGYILAAIEARMNPRRQVKFTDPDDPAADPAVEDTRTLDQRRLEAFAAIARESLQHDPGDMSGTPVAMLVTITEEALTTGVGTAQIFGVGEPVSAKTARRMACSAKIFPVVLSGDSVPLDFGQGRRLFSEAQRLAMALRDGGCVWWGCPEPPGRCDAAHVEGWWAQDGPTNLSNGVLLCPYHHRRFDNDGWALEFRNGIPYLVPPAWVD